MNHFTQNDLVGSGDRIRLKEFAVPFSNSLKNQLEDAKQKLHVLQKENDEKDHRIQKLVQELKKFQENSLAQFAVNASQDPTDPTV